MEEREIEWGELVFGEMEVQELSSGQLAQQGGTQVKGWLRGIIRDKEHAEKGPKNEGVETGFIALL